MIDDVDDMIESFVGKGDHGRTAGTVRQDAESCGSV